ncbi:hypothetical protein BDZ91DRAFT_796299 [Kalaharituber pfeilii]|nr:hypothetical protein BDZ91DRAFT_796299 [Kalaharituber pfeilii]
MPAVPARSLRSTAQQSSVQNPRKRSRRTSVNEDAIQVGSPISETIMNPVSKTSPPQDPPRGDSAAKPASRPTGTRKVRKNVNAEPSRGTSSTVPIESGPNLPDANDQLPNINSKTSVTLAATTGANKLPADGYARQYPVKKSAIAETMLPKFTMPPKTVDDDALATDLSKFIGATKPKQKQKLKQICKPKAATNASKPVGKQKVEPKPAVTHQAQLAIPAFAPPQRSSPISAHLTKLITKPGELSIPASNSHASSQEAAPNSFLHTITAVEERLPLGRFTLPSQSTSLSNSGPPVKGSVNRVLRAYEDEYQSTFFFPHLEKDYPPYRSTRKFGIHYEAPTHPLAYASEPAVATSRDAESEPLDYTIKVAESVAVVNGSFHSLFSSIDPELLKPISDENFSELSSDIDSDGIIVMGPEDPDDDSDSRAGTSTLLRFPYGSASTIVDEYDTLVNKLKVGIQHRADVERRVVEEKEKREQRTRDQEWWERGEKWGERAKWHAGTGRSRVGATMAGVGAAEAVAGNTRAGAGSKGEEDWLEWLRALVREE